MTTTAKTVFALPKACFAAAALIAGLAASSAQASVARQDTSAGNTTVVASYSYPSGNAGMVSPRDPAVSRSAEVASHAGAGLQLTPDPSLLFVAALGALCLSLSWRRPAARHADKLRQRLASAEAQG